MPSVFDPARVRRAPVPTVADVIAVAAQFFEVEPEQLIGGGRGEPLVWFRQAAMAAARELSEAVDGYSASYPAIGRAFHRDHSTVMHSVARAYAPGPVNHYRRLLVAELRRLAAS